MKSREKSWLVAFGFVVAIALAGCAGGDGDGDRPCNNIVASEGSCVVCAGQSGNVESRQIDANGHVTEQRCQSPDDNRSETNEAPESSEEG